jgi:hypothetical protein
MIKQFMTLFGVIGASLCHAQTNIFESNGKVGIGTQSPIQTFNVQGTWGNPATSGTQQNGVAAFSVNETYSAIFLGSFSANPYGTWIQASARHDLGNLTLSLNPNGGNVGIGVAVPTSKLTVNGGENSRAIEIVGGNYYESSNSYSFPALSFYSTINAVKSAVPTSEIRFVDRPGTYGYAANVRTSDIEFYTSRNWDGSIYTHVPSLTMTIKSNQDGGYVGIGTAVPKEKLSVNGKIRAHEIKVEQNSWPDYVFKSGYQLMPLQKIESFIKEKGHLPEVPSAKEVAKEGVELGNNQALLLKKIEEITLHLISINKRVESLEAENRLLKKQLEKSFMK